MDRETLQKNRARKARNAANPDGELLLVRRPPRPPTAPIPHFLHRRHHHHHRLHHHLLLLRPWQHEFVSACVRLAVLRYLVKPCAGDPQVATHYMSEALELLLERHIVPFATFEVRPRDTPLRSSSLPTRALALQSSSL